MLPLERVYHPLGHHYPGVKLHTTVNPRVIQCAVSACVHCAFFMLHCQWRWNFICSVYLSPSFSASTTALPPLSSAPLFSPLLLCIFFLSSLFHSLLPSSASSPHYSLSLLLYHSPYRGILEEFFYSDLASVNDEEPPTFHTLIFNLQTRVDNYLYLIQYLLWNSQAISHPHTYPSTCTHTQYVYASHLMRKDKLVNFFKELGIYQEDVRLPVEVPNTGDNISNFAL